MKPFSFAKILLAFALVCAFVSCDSEKADDDPYMRDCRLHVSFDPGQNDVERVFVEGDFNLWKPADIELSKDEDGIFRKTLELDPGEYLYSLRYDGKLAIDGGNPLTMFDQDEYERSYIKIADCSMPALRIDKSEVSGGILNARAVFLKASDGSLLDAQSVTAKIKGGESLQVKASPDPGIVLIEGELSVGKSHVILEAADENSAEAESVDFAVWNEDEPFDWNDALIYQIVVDRFRKGGGELTDDIPISYRHGGDLYGIIEAVEEGYFTSMGVNTLWISPMYKNPEGYWPGLDGYLYESFHGYWPIEARGVEDRFGGEEALLELVRVCHERGIRLVVDMVMNHVHIMHPYWQEKQDQDWFNSPDKSCVCGSEDCSWAEAIDHCWFTEYLPDFKWKNPEVVEQVVDDTYYWLEHFDLDGLRLDAIPMMPRMATRHLRDLIRKKNHNGGAHVYLLGETYTGKGGYGQIKWYLGPQGLSGQFDFPFMWTVRDVIANENGSFKDIDDILQEGAAAWEGSGAVMAPIIGNHDVTRFISVAAGDDLSDAWKKPPLQPKAEEPYKKLKMALTLMMTSVGAPIIYYGDETGLAGAGDPDNRRPFTGEEGLDEMQADVLKTVQLVGRVYRSMTSLRRGERSTLKAEKDTYIYARHLEGEDPAFVLFNRSKLAKRISFSIPEHVGYQEDRLYVDIFSNPLENEEGIIGMTLPPQSSAVLVPFEVRESMEIN